MVRIRRIRLSFFVFLSLLVLFSCKKKTEEDDYEEPVISFVSPAGSVSFHVFDTIPIKVEISDNKVVSNVSIQLTSMSGASWYEPFFYQSTQTSMVAEAKLVLSDIHMESGFYLIRVEASDGQNLIALSRQIYIYTSPVEKLGYFIYTGNAASSQHLQLDTNFIAKGQVYYSYPHVYAGIDLRNQYFMSLPGALNQSLPVRTLSFQEQVYVVPNRPEGYVCALMQNNALFVGFSNDRVEYYYGEGQFKGIFQSGDVYTKPIKLCQRANNLWVIYEMVNLQGVYRLVVFDVQTHVAKMSWVLSDVPVEMMAHTDEEITLLTNEASGMPHLLQFHEGSNIVYEPAGLDPFEVTAAFKFNDNKLLIAQSNGRLYQFNPDLNEVKDLGSVGNVRQIKGNEEEGLVYLAKANELVLYKLFPTSLVIKQSYVMSDTIRDFLVHYNK